jgi:hypothetical protein
MSILACEKMPFDYRNIYIGKYDVIRYNTEINSLLKVVITDTIAYTGDVKYGSSKYDIEFSYYNIVEEFNIKKDGTMSIGQIRNDTLRYGRWTYIDGNIRRFFNVVAIKKK